MFKKFIYIEAKNNIILYSDQIYSWGIPVVDLNTMTNMQMKLDESQQ